MGKHIGNRERHFREDVEQSKGRKPNLKRHYWIKEDRHLQWAEHLTLASDLHRGQIFSTSSRRECKRNSTCWNSCPHIEHVRVIHKGAVTVNLIELCFVWSQVRHSGFATFFPWINCMTGLFEISIMCLFIKFTFISTFPGSFFSSTFQRNNHVSQFVSIESLTGHAVWVLSRSPSYPPIFDTRFPKTVSYWAPEDCRAFVCCSQKDFLIMAVSSR